VFRLQRYEIDFNYASILKNKSDIKPLLFANKNHRVSVLTQTKVAMQQRFRLICAIGYLKMITNPIVINIPSIPIKVIRLLNF